PDWKPNCPDSASSRAVRPVPAGPTMATTSPRCAVTDTEVKTAPSEPVAERSWATRKPEAGSGASGIAAWPDEAAGRTVVASVAGRTVVASASDGDAVAVGSSVVVSAAGDAAGRLSAVAESRSS